MTPRPRDTVALRFSNAQAVQHNADLLRHDISELSISDDELFVACDQTAPVERLSRDGEADVGHHAHLRLGDCFKLPDGPHDEMDIEGLAIADSLLWFIGSHALKRERPRRNKHGAMVTIARMMDIERGAKRCFSAACR